MTTPRRGRRTLLLIAMIFAAPLVVATILAFSGYLPQGRKNHGDLIEPPLALAELEARSEQGSFRFTTPQWQWTLLLRIPANCDSACASRLDQVANLRTSLGRHAVKLRIAIDRTRPQQGILGQANGVYVLQQWPAEIDAVLPPPERDLSAMLIDPNGYAMLRFDEGSDLKGMRTDLGRVIR